MNVSISTTQQVAMEFVMERQQQVHRCFPYSFSGLTSFSSSFGACAGSYSITVTDANGCTTNSTATMAYLITVAMMSTDVNCNGGTDGDAAIENRHITILLFVGDGQVAQTATGLSANYYVPLLMSMDVCRILPQQQFPEPAVLYHLPGSTDASLEMPMVRQ